MTSALHLVFEPGGRARLYAHGIMVDGLKAVIAHPGADIMLLVDRDTIRIGDAAPRPTGQDLLPAGTRLPTDGDA